MPCLGWRFNEGTRSGSCNALSRSGIHGFYRKNLPQGPSAKYRFLQKGYSLAYKPDVLILVDHPGFNLRIADFAAKNGIHVIYYISPQIWAWKQSRIHQIKRNVNRMIVILPFEKDFYRKHDFNVDFVGHPLLDAISNRARDENANSFKSLNKLSDKPIIALLPGSRKQEIKTMLPLMLSVRNQFPDYQFVIGAAPSLEESFYKDITGNSDSL